ncbi:unnamed protein product [Acanthoscelides obtectus]|uniref:Uncharacterized protein n=1 Tax=Acanthoscelides obtectus TaxID=200917 RepID=A0A9P0K0C0_ACAOB|nr:unnamed protein product [Acanthoscelides obtectus]CAK1647196.1 hypothetical protein AOBTE_LOCUS15100 [Acanthoscelides obtectus]
MYNVSVKFKYDAKQINSLLSNSAVNQIMFALFPNLTPEDD